MRRDSAASSSHSERSPQQLDVASHDRDGRAQFVARISDETPLVLVGALEPGQHRVERGSEGAELVGGAVVGDTPTGAGVGHAGCIGRHLPQRSQALPSGPDRGEGTPQYHDEACGTERAGNARSDLGGGLGPTAPPGRARRGCHRHWRSAQTARGRTGRPASRSTKPAGALVGSLAAVLPAACSSLSSELEMTRPSASTSRIGSGPADAPVRSRR